MVKGLTITCMPSLSWTPSTTGVLGVAGNKQHFQPGQDLTRRLLQPGGDGTCS